MPFAFMQNGTVPNITINSVILAQGDELKLTASNLSDGSYKLVLNSPSGQVISQTIDTKDGYLDYALNLDEGGNWAINLSGNGLDTAMQVSVMPLLTSEPDSTETEAVATTTVNDTELTNEATDTILTDNSEASTSNENTDTQTTANIEESADSSQALNTSVDNIIEETSVSIENIDNSTNLTVISTETTEVSTTQEPATEEPVTELTETTNTEEASTEADEITAAEASTETVESAITQETSINTQASEITETTTSTQNTPEENLTDDESNTTEALLEADTNNNTAENTSTVTSEQSISTNQETTEETAITNNIEGNTDGEIANNLEDNTENNTENTTEPEAQAAQTETEVPEVSESQVFAPLSNAPIDFSIIDSNLLAKQSNNTIWNLDFAKDSGETSPDIIQQENLVYLGHGNSLLRIDSKTGKILARWLLSGQIISLSENTNDISIDVKIDDGNTENFILSANTLDRAAHFNSNPSLYSWLENEANVANPAARLTQDPTNPWLYLKAAQANSDSVEAKSLYNNAIATTNSFYDAAGISRHLLDSGQNALSTKSFSKALGDFAARGYDPRLLTNMDLHESYNFPVKALNTAVAQGNLTKAAVLAEQVKYFLSPNNPDVRASLVSYADLLKKNGNKDEANNWRKIAKSSNKTTVSNILDKIFASLANVAWYAALATLLSTLALHLVLLFKYWRPQSVILNRKRESGKKPSPIARLFAIRYYSTTEKLVLALILASTVLLAGLGTWNDKAGNLPKAIGSGSYANASIQSFVNSTNLSTQQGNFIKAYTAQANNQANDAEKYYRAAGEYPQALNNLAILTGDNNLFVETLKHAKNLPEALFNSGQEVEGFDFQKDFLAGKPILSVPTNEDFQAALSGSWQDAVAKTFTSTYLLNANPFGLNPILWKVILALFAIYTLLSLVWILWPRPRMARNAPRSFIYNILSFLVPGSGMADEMWGILLLLPWAIFGLDAISRFFGLGFAINGLSLRLDYFVLGAIYIINLIAIVIEFLSYRQRMNKLKEDDIDLAREFNLIK